MGTNLGILRGNFGPADDPQYFTGPVANGRKKSKPKIRENTRVAPRLSKREKSPAEPASLDSEKKTLRITNPE